MSEHDELSDYLSADFSLSIEDGYDSPLALFHAVKQSLRQWYGYPVPFITRRTPPWDDGSQEGIELMAVLPDGSHADRMSFYNWMEDWWEPREALIPARWTVGTTSPIQWSFYPDKVRRLDAMLVRDMRAWVDGGHADE